MSADRSRLDWVDTAKGLSIILVVMMHSAYGVGDDTGQVGILHYVIGWATPFRMPEFFLISGLFMSQVIARPWRLFADRRILHYFYFYVLWAVLQILFKVGLGTGDLGAAGLQILSIATEPYGVLWFIYMLAIYSLVTKLLFTLRVPHWVAFAVAAALQITQTAGMVSNITAFDHFASYYVYFYAGYACSAVIFRIVSWAQANVPAAIALLLVYGLIEGVLVFSGDVQMMPRGIQMGYASIPGLWLVLGFLGSIAICVAAALLVRVPWMRWLQWLGERSIVVYLSFSIPMAALRTLLLKLHIVEDTSIVSVLVWLFALTTPVILYWLIQITGWGKFLFERPAWAHIPGTPGSREDRSKSGTQPAE